MGRIFLWQQEFLFNNFAGGNEHSLVHCQDKNKKFMVVYTITFFCGFI
jgi:hypothetical protein